MSRFADALRSVAARVPETQLADRHGRRTGSPSRSWSSAPDPNLDAVAAEYTTLLRASVSAAADTGLGDLQELSVVTEKMVAMLVAITSEYFLFAAPGPGRRSWAAPASPCAWPASRCEKEFA